MKMIKVFSGVLLASTLVYGSGEFQVETEYINHDEILKKKAYVDYSIEGEPVVILAEAYTNQGNIAVNNKTDDVYVEPTVDGYVDQVLIDEEPMYINSSSNLGNAVNVYNSSKHLQKINENTQNSTTQNTSSFNSQSSVNSKNSFYAGLGITALNYDIKCDCPDKSAKDTALGGMTKIGYNFNKFIGIEARGMKVNLKNGMGSVNHVGVFLKPMLPLGPVVTAYSLVGVAKTKTNGKVREVDTTSVALGAGMEFGGGKGIGAFIDYEKLVVTSGAPSFDTVTTGVSFGF